MALRRRFGDADDLEDVVDDAMLRLVDLPNLQQQRVPALLYTAAHNLNIDRHRRAVRHQRLALRLREQRVESPDEVVVSRERLSEAMDCVAGMSRKEREALAGRVMGYRPSETAELLGVSTTSVYQALSRARTTLRATLGGAAATLLALRRFWTPRGAGVSISAATVSVALTLAVHPWTATPARPVPVASFSVPTVTSRFTPLREVWRGTSAVHTATVQHPAMTPQMLQLRSQATMRGASGAAAPPATTMSAPQPDRDVVPSPLSVIPPAAAVASSGGAPPVALSRHTSPLIAG